MKILHLIGQKPGETGSGIYARNIVKVAKSKEYLQCVVAGIDKTDKQYLKAFPKDVLFHPVFFNSKELPFPVPGMSDAMPYSSTKYSEMTEDMFFLWKKAFTAALYKAGLFKPDLVIVHHLWLLAALGREIFPNTPTIGICHSTEFRQLASAKQFKDYVINGCRKLDGIAALGAYQKNVIEKLYGISGDKVKVVGGGFANEVFYPSKKKLKQDKVKLLYVGKISKAKGVPSLLRVFTNLPIPKDKVELIIAGSGSEAEYEEIMSMAKKAGNVKLLGLVSQPILSNIMRESHILVLPSFYEGFSLVTVEALASGLRVVVNELPALREWISKELEESGIVKFVKMPKLIDVDTPEPLELPAFEDRLKDGILTQIREVEKSDTTSLLGWQEMVYKYSWQAIFGKIEDIYSNLLNHKKL
jgi:glycosyltransferase involved in cell wall biosynthesis